MVGTCLRTAVPAHHLLNTVTDFLPDLAYEQDIRLHALVAVGSVFLRLPYCLPVSTKDMMSFLACTSNYSLDGLIRQLNSQGLLNCYYPENFWCCILQAYIAAAVFSGIGM